MDYFPFWMLLPASEPFVSRDHPLISLMQEHSSLYTTWKAPVHQTNYYRNTLSYTFLHLYNLLLYFISDFTHSGNNRNGRYTNACSKCCLFRMQLNVDYKNAYGKLWTLTNTIMHCNLKTIPIPLAKWGLYDLDNSCCLFLSAEMCSVRSICTPNTRRITISFRLIIVK